MTTQASELLRTGLPGTVTYGQAAQILGVSRRTIDNLVADGRIATLFVTSVPRIPIDELDRILNAPRVRRTKRPAAPTPPH